jgi:hypothetical protein
MSIDRFLASCLLAVAAVAGALKVIERPFGAAGADRQDVIGVRTRRIIAYLADGIAA